MTQPSKPGRVVVLESRVGAHSGYYLQYLAAGWARASPLTHELVLLLPPTFADLQPDAFVALQAEEERGRGVHLEIIATEKWRRAVRPPRWLGPLVRLPGLRRHLRLRAVFLSQWLVLRRELDRLQPDRALAMSLDDLLLPAVLFPPRRETELAGILFKPSFHYDRFAVDERTGPARIRARFELSLLRQFCRRQGTQIFSLDPWAVEALRTSLGENIHLLPEPARSEPPPPGQVEQLAERLGVDRSRQIFLLLGALDRRRGLAEVLAAIERLEPDTAGKICLLLAGTVGRRERPAALDSIEYLQRTTRCQVVLAEGRIGESELLAYFDLSDVVLVTHRHHIGSSGNLLHAAAAGKPVIATRAGLIGEQVRSHRLGLTVDASSPAEIAGAMHRVLSATTTELPDTPSTARLAAENTPERYASSLIDVLSAEST